MSLAEMHADPMDRPLVEALASLSARDTRIVVNIIRRIVAIEKEHGEDVADAAFERIVGMIRTDGKTSVM